MPEEKVEIQSIELAKEIDKLRFEKAELLNQVKKLKKRVVRTGQIAVDESVLRKLFVILWNRQYQKIDKRHVPTFYNEMFSEQDRRGSKFEAWLNSNV